MPLEHRVGTGKIAWIIKPAGDFDDVFQPAAGQNRNGTDICDHLLRLRDDPTRHDFIVRRRNLAGHLDKIASPISLVKRSAGTASLSIGTVITGFMQQSRIADTDAPNCSSLDCFPSSLAGG